MTTLVQYSSVFMYDVSRPARATGIVHRLERLPRNAEGWVFESQSRQTQFVKTGCDSSTAKRSATGAIVTGPRR